MPRVGMILGRLAGAAALAGMLGGCAQPEPLPELGRVPDFSLIERTGARFGRSDLAGRVWIADFIFTHCGLSCPMMTAQMKALYAELPEEVRFVSITVDPANDTPEVLSTYADRQGVEGDRWVFLTGERDVIYRLSIEGFYLGVDDTMGRELEPILHSTRFVLVDRAGAIRGYYDALDFDALDRLARDAGRLLAE